MTILENTTPGKNWHDNITSVFFSYLYKQQYALLFHIRNPILLNGNNRLIFNNNIKTMQQKYMDKTKKYFMVNCTTKKCTPVTQVINFLIKEMR